ncbi:MAG: D-alanyl-D-alanine carboxypeptidase [Spirochaetaceae bacterium]|jgi:D-alanyl-D-alanine carboxypeptidase (penicillin-binding protein 5/6)|nr:D-alanyl-D-alanine carboxypeptidase [Spirochaetaceae bacterium]
MNKPTVKRTARFRRYGLPLCILAALFCTSGFFFRFKTAAAETYSGNPLFPSSEPPQIRSPSAVLIDGKTGTLLYSFNPSLVISPASLTKLMTIHLALRQVAQGRISVDDIVELPPESWAENQPPRSSLMFLDRGHRVSLGELLLGLAVSSGNDAAVAVALHAAPTMEAFVTMMNTEAGRLGLVSTRFFEPAGISSENTTTAMDFALFCKAYLQEHPSSTGLLHSVPVFAYPGSVNTGTAKPPTIVQYNHNALLGFVPGVDGLKTGHITEAGYNIALSALRGNTRLIAVLLGEETEEDRDRDGETLLNWGFDNFITIDINAGYLPSVRIWGGGEKYIPVKPGESTSLTASNKRAGVLEQEVKLIDDLKAPLAAGAAAGVLIIRDEFGELKRIPLVLERPVYRGNFFRVVWDNIALFFKKLFSK